MPWPKGQPFSREHIQKRSNALILSGARRKRTEIIDGLECWKCCTCKKWLGRDQFYKSKKNTAGIGSQCRPCHCATSIRTRDKVKDRQRGIIHEATRRARLSGSGGRVRAADLEKLITILGDVCQKCASSGVLQWDHILPIARGGLHHPQNLQRLCRKCNERKQASCADYRSELQTALVRKTWVVEFKRV